MKTIKSLWESLKVIFKAKEVQPLSAVNAQALSFYGESYNYDNMIKRFKKEMFKDIKSSTFFGRDYCVEKIPNWLIPDKDTLITELKLLGYEIIEVKEVQLLIIHWDN